MKIRKKSNFSKALILGFSMICFLTFAQPVHADVKNKMTINSGIINIYVKMAEITQGNLIEKGISGDSLTVKWERKETGVFCKKAKEFEAQIKHPTYPQWLVKRTRVGQKGKGLCSFTRQIDYSYLELSALYWEVKDGKEYSTDSNKIHKRLYELWKYHKGTTYKRKFTAIGKVNFEEGLKVIFGSTIITEKTIDFDVAWNFVDETQKKVKGDIKYDVTPKQSVVPQR